MIYNNKDSLKGYIMKHLIHIKYNPFTVSTDITIDGLIQTFHQHFDYIQGRRLQDYLLSKEDSHVSLDSNELPWRGLFTELFHFLAKSNVDNIYELVISFEGTQYDFDDLLILKNQNNLFQSVEFKFDERSKNTHTLVERMEGLQRIYHRIEQGPIESLKDPSILSTLQHILKNEFHLSVVGLMKSGKSTFLNALLHQDLLPSRNMRTTAVLNYIRDNDQAPYFKVTEVDSDNLRKTYDEPATKALIDQLNDAEKDHQNPDSRFIKEIHIEGDIPKISSKILNAVFVDTPGGNNELVPEDEAKMIHAIRDENNGMILYVLNGRNLDTKDEHKILKEISATMNAKKLGKQSNERFLFVVTQIDEFNLEGGDNLNVLATRVFNKLSSAPFFIKEPNVFFVSSLAAKLTRIQNLNRMDKSKLNNYIEQLQDPHYWYWKYSTISTEEKEMYSNYVESLISQEAYLKMVEFNSGFVTLEKAIDQYLNKYAVAVKIKMVHDTFMNKVVEINMVENQRMLVREKEETLKKLSKELDFKNKEFEKIKASATYLKQVADIRIHEQAFADIKKTVQLEMDTLIESFQTQKHVKNDEMKELLKNFSKKSQTIVKNVEKKVDEVTTETNKVIVSLINNYQKLIKQIQKANLLQIGDVQLSKFDKFPKLQLDALVSISDKYKNTETTKKQVYIQGSWWERFWGKIFGYDADYTIYQDETIEVYDVSNIIKENGEKIKLALEQNFQSIVHDFSIEFNRVKNITIEGAKKLTDAIQEKYDELKLMLSEQQNAQKVLDEAKKKFEYTESIIQEVEKLMEV